MGVGGSWGGKDGRDEGGRAMINLLPRRHTSPTCGAVSVTDSPLATSIKAIICLLLC